MKPDAQNALVAYLSEQETRAIEAREPNAQSVEVGILPATRDAGHGNVGDTDGQEYSGIAALFPLEECFQTQENCEPRSEPVQAALNKAAKTTARAYFFIQNERQRKKAKSLMKKAYEEDFLVRKTFSIPTMVLEKSEVRYFRDADSSEATLLANVLRYDVPDIVPVKIKPDRYPRKTNPRYFEVWFALKDLQAIE